MSKGARWTAEELTKRGWRDPDKPKDELRDADTVAVLNAGFRQTYVPKQPISGLTPGGSCRETPAEAISAVIRAAGAPKRASKPIPYERDVLKAVLAALKAHPRVAWAVRLNSGMAMLPGRGGKPQPVRYGFEGCSDIIGQMGVGAASFPYDWYRGAFLAVEVKRPGKKPTLAQAAFLLRVRESGGVGFVADSVDSVWEHLGKP